MRLIASIFIATYLALAIYYLTQDALVLLPHYLRRISARVANLMPPEQFIAHLLTATQAMAAILRASLARGQTPTLEVISNSMAPSRPALTAIA